MLIQDAHQEFESETVASEWEEGLWVLAKTGQKKQLKSEKLSQLDPLKKKRCVAFVVTLCASQKTCLIVDMDVVDRFILIVSLAASSTIKALENL